MRTGLGSTRPKANAPEDGLQPAAIAEALSDPVVGALDGTIRSWNAGAEQLFGYRAEEIVGKPVSILYPPERLGELKEILSRLRRGEAIPQFETVRRRKDGTDVQVSLSISPVRCPSGEIVGTAIVHDISDRKRREDIQSFLAEASRLLAVNLDYHETLSRVAELTLAHLADWCLVETADAAGSFTQVAVAHRNQDKAELARELLPVIDNLERALQSSAEGEPLARGVALVLDELRGKLQAAGVEAYDPVGERFDPKLHEALSTRPVEGTDSGVVVETVEKGYRLNGQVLRPARVVVSD